ncbi:phosphatidylethanolamine N-methyltransferase, partial [Rhizophlyctis rosea]
MLHTLFSFGSVKTAPEWITLVLIGVQSGLQSNKRGIVSWARHHGFEPNTKNRKPWVQYMINGIKLKMGPSFDYESHPLEFTSWLHFRSLVDIILVNDFTTYLIFVLAYFRAPEGGHGIVDILRYAGGAGLLAFNVWVKVDAHRVVRDFAWYWGDFFFLSSTTLTFDGVFELAPHPMYSVGYIGYYGASLIAQSYWVLFVSLLAHACQMAFLWVVEEPHIEKTYGGGESTARKERNEYFKRDLTIFKNFDFFRASDLMTGFIVLQTLLLTLIIGPIDHSSSFTDWKYWFYVSQALVWRTVYNYGLGAVLYLQGERRWWNKHFVKHGDSGRDGFGSWKV